MESNKGKLCYGKSFDEVLRKGHANLIQFESIFI